MKTAYDSVFLPIMVTFGIDEQELNPGTFIREDVLHGLEKKLTSEEIRKIGLNNFSAHIADKNNFIKTVRESRAIDLRDIVCSNAHTEFLSCNLTGEQCFDRTKRGIEFTNSCQQCLLDRVTCTMKKINESCQRCSGFNTTCVSLVVVQILWDMGSDQKKADNDYYHLDAKSSIEEMLSTEMVSIGFGGLHLGKSFVCTARNYVLLHNGEHFGVNILHELSKHVIYLRL